MPRPVALAVPATTSEQVADLFDVVAAADTELGAVFDRIAASRAPIHPATIAELEHLLEDTLRPAVQARAALARTLPALLHAGLLCRRQRSDAGRSVTR